MMKGYLSLLLLFSLLCAANPQSLLAQTSTGNSVQTVKTDVSRRGTGEKSKVVVKMKDGRKLKGFISQSGEESFDLTDSKTKQTTSLAYRDVTQVKKQGLSTAAKIAIGAGVVFLGVGVLAAATIRGSDSPF